MEFFGALFGLILLIVLIVVGIGIIAFPIIFDLALHDAYYEYPLCHGFAVLQLIGIFWIMSQMSSSKTGETVLAVLCTIVITIIAMIRAYNRSKKIGCEPSECAGAVLAQMLLPVSIVIILFMVSSILDDIKKKFEKK